MYTTEENRKTLWSLLQEQSNRRCMDCTAQDPTFACAALGTFVCVRCAELLHEFGLQVKSVISSSFSEEEIKYLLQQGNAVARHKWLARWTPAEFPEPSHLEDPNRVRQFMLLKYKEKKWANSTANLVNPLSYVENAAPTHPFPASPDTDRSTAYNTPQKEGTPKLIDFSPFIHKASAVQQMQDPNRNPFPMDMPVMTDFMTSPPPPDFTSPGAPRKDLPPYNPNDPFSVNRNQQPHNPFVDETPPPSATAVHSPPLTFQPIMSPPTHPHSPPPSDPLPNPFINPYLNHITPMPSPAPSPAPSPQVYNMPPNNAPNNATPSTTSPNPLALSQQIHASGVHPNATYSTPISSPLVQSPPPPGVAPPNNIGAIGSPLATPISSPLVTPSAAPQQQQSSNAPLQQQLQQQQLQQQLQQQQQQQQQQQLQQQQQQQQGNLPPQSSSQQKQQQQGQPQPPQQGQQSQTLQGGSGSYQNHVAPLSRAASADDTSRMLEEVRTLKQLFEMQMMGKDEYEARRIQLIDTLTKTTHSNPSPPPVLEPRLVGTERAIRHRFDCKKNKWCHTATIVILEQNPFAEGAMRKAYRMRDLSQEGQLSLMVAKMFRDANEDRASYFKDVEMQMQAKEIAERFNRRNPPKKVDFVTAFVYELVDRPNKQICCAEYYIDGKFEKHNNNYGYINDDTERNTPQVFSHFSYEDSNGQLIVVDIQGVGDVYTDPQIHTLDGQGYGRGNLGAEGINKFFSTHACNQICHFYGLTAVNPKQPLMDAGTKPQPKLNQSQNDVGRFDFRGDVFDVFRAPQGTYNYHPK